MMLFRYRHPPCFTMPTMLKMNQTSPARIMGIAIFEVGGNWMNGITSNVLFTQMKTNKDVSSGR
jgi:hypothetical protein